MNIIKLAGKSLNTSSKRKIKNFILNNIHFDRLVATYDTWVIENYPDTLDVLKQREEAQKFAYQPLISVTVPTYDTPIEFLHECIRSVMAQSYENWELLLVDDASPDKKVREVIKEYAAKDSRIRFKFLEKNHHIAGATNEAIKISKGDFIGLFDHDDILWPNALYEVAKVINENKDADFIYTDEDKIVEKKSHHAEPFFKPDWSPELLRTCNYITHFSVFKKSLLDKVGYENGEYNGAQDWEMILRATRSAKNIQHIPKILYSWRVHDNSTAKTMEAKPYVIEAQKAAIKDDLRARGYKAEDYSITQNSRYFAFWKTKNNNIGTPLVSVISLGAKQAKSIRRKTNYTNCEFITVDSYNQGINISKGEYVVFIEPEMTLTSKKWVEILLNSAVYKEAGAVGGLNVYKNGEYIYSAGVSLNQEGKLVHVLSGGVRASHLKTLTRTMYVHTKRNTTAICGALMISRKHLGDYTFKDEISTEEQLVALGLEQAKKGLSNVYDPDFIVIKNVKYHNDNKHTNKERKKTYKDKELSLSIDKAKYRSVTKHRYFYDDLVSYPETDAF